MPQRSFIKKHLKKGKRIYIEYLYGAQSQIDLSQWDHEDCKLWTSLISKTKYTEKQYFQKVEYAMQELNKQILLWKELAWHVITLNEKDLKRLPTEEQKVVLKILLEYLKLEGHSRKNDESLKINLS